MKLFLLCISMCAFAGGLERPVVGHVVDAHGRWHAVEGVPGAFVVGPVTEPDERYTPATELSLEHRETGFYVADAEGGTVEILPPEAQCAVLLTQGVLYASSEELVLGTVRIGLTGVAKLRPMSAEFVQVSTAEGEYLLRVEPGREALFALPAIAGEELE